jgi:hypothetical protein
MPSVSGTLLAPQCYLCAAMFLANLLVLSASESVKEGMTECLLGSKTLPRVQFQNAFKKGDCLLRHLPCVTSLKCIWLGEIWELVPNKSRIPLEALLLFIDERPAHLLDHIELVHFRQPGEQGLTVRKLTHNAPYGPYVDRFRVVITNEKLWRPIPPCCDIVCHLYITLVLREVPSKSKIAKLEEVGLRAYEQILRLDVPMNDVIVMAVVNSLE